MRENSIGRRSAISAIIKVFGAASGVTTVMGAALDNELRLKVEQRKVDPANVPACQDANRAGSALLGLCVAGLYGAHEMDRSFES